MEEGEHPKKGGYSPLEASVSMVTAHKGSRSLIGTRLLPSGDAGERLVLAADHHKDFPLATAAEGSSVDPGTQEGIKLHHRHRLAGRR
jgi:hypothetical protein